MGLKPIATEGINWSTNTWAIYAKYLFGHYQVLNTTVYWEFHHGDGFKTHRYRRADFQPTPTWQSLLIPLTRR
jgi:hypothetical protein